ncbi:hypothetical protein KCH_12120 [Kitasatospora cheerisanensis KCTC 2395]|uniref:Uncharacterized protein n=1 Tax=Kitasatospora cheerisanensis KCTC 2395 TaxID=1348663 RepID=A0A066Z0X2_9ACTN|nr:hypothetical protein KCH_12120 [Kitasatospora cheerisanensis KCTC 2395]
MDPHRARPRARRRHRRPARADRRAVRRTRLRRTGAALRGRARGRRADGP